VKISTASAGPSRGRRSQQGISRKGNGGTPKWQGLAESSLFLSKPICVAGSSRPAIPPWCDEQGYNHCRPPDVPCRASLTMKVHSFFFFFLVRKFAIKLITRCAPAPAPHARGASNGLGHRAVELVIEFVKPIPRFPWILRGHGFAVWAGSVTIPSAQNQYTRAARVRPWFSI